MPDAVTVKPEVRDAGHGEKTIEFTVRFWTNGIVPGGIGRGD